jgi:hypothetical protein
VWSDRVDQLKALRRSVPRDPYDWVPVSELRRGDRFLFGGDWFRVIDAAPIEEHRMLTAACGATKTVIDYLAFETVKVALPRPERT